ncbi:hypothetical protein Q361_1561 [Flavobacterium croceum DSM 17960]|uniref:Uncharacterized protein n=1 Tax=Flavobacterium croceum DSM 17960 TaxID=1121886 RepID=A0A2S4N4A2_9FLAO|nr:hypothetical protein [Flavobacterium croceum]POS00572.1 hypothetical protein Q361_1561 [Flavobacterium croceum DSM 17960]
MAIWMQIIGKRNLKSIEYEREYFSQILKDINSSFFSINQDENVWKLNEREGMEFFEYRFSEETTLDSIRITFNNSEFIDFSGSFEYFSTYYKFVDYENRKSTEEWRKIFKTIAKAYGITELYYFSEDFFPLEYIYDNESKAVELFNLLENGKESKELYNLNYDEYFVEQIIQ